MTTTELIGRVIAAIALLVLVWVPSLWLRRLLGRFVADAAADGTDNGDPLPCTPVEACARRRSTGPHRRLSRRSAQSGISPRSFGLERRRLVVADRSLTNREAGPRRLPTTLFARSCTRWSIPSTCRYGVQEPDATTFAGDAVEIDGVGQAAESAATTGEARPA